MSDAPLGAGTAVTLRTLLLAGAFPLVPRDKLPPGTDPLRLYGEFTPTTLVQGAWGWVGCWVGGWVAGWGGMLGGLGGLLGGWVGRWGGMLGRWVGWDAGWVGG